MKQLNRRNLKNLILKEMRMLGMEDMGAIGDMGAMMPHDMHMDDHHGGHEGMTADEHSHTSMSAKGSLSKEQCCAAIICLAEACSCPMTKNKIIAMCESMMQGHM